MSGSFESTQPTSKRVGNRYGKRSKLSSLNNQVQQPTVRSNLDQIQSQLKSNPQDQLNLASTSIERDSKAVKVVLILVNVHISS